MTGEASGGIDHDDAKALRRMAEEAGAEACPFCGEAGAHKAGCPHARAAMVRAIAIKAPDMLDGACDGAPIDRRATGAKPERRPWWRPW